MTIPVYINQEVVGALTVTRDGLYTVLEIEAAPALVLIVLHLSCESTDLFAISDSCIGALSIEDAFSYIAFQNAAVFECLSRRAVCGAHSVGGLEDCSVSMVKSAFAVEISVLKAALVPVAVIVPVRSLAVIIPIDKVSDILFAFG